MSLDTVAWDLVSVYQYPKSGRVFGLRLEYKKHRWYVVYVVPYTNILAVFWFVGCWIRGLFSIGAIIIMIPKTKANSFARIVEDWKRDTDSCLDEQLEALARVAQARYERARMKLCECIDNRLRVQGPIALDEFYDMFGSLAAFTEEVYLHEEFDLGQTEQANWLRCDGAPSRNDRRLVLERARECVIKFPHITGKHLVFLYLQEKDWESAYP